MFIKDSCAKAYYNKGTATHLPFHTNLVSLLTFCGWSTISQSPHFQSLTFQLCLMKTLSDLSLEIVLELKNDDIIHQNSG